MRKIIFLITINLFMIQFSLLAQSDISNRYENRHKSCIYGSLGTAFVYSNISGNIEQEISYNPDKFFSTMSLRIGGGYWSSWGNEGYDITGTVNYLSGSGGNHMEMGFGIAFSPGYDETYGFLPAVHAGYRYQKPGEFLVFRAGVGVPDTLYLSLGVCF